jgi:hypothetical protein
MIKSIITYIKFLAALALIGAGVIHTFPSVWIKWDSLVQTSPSLHYQIGAIGFILGIGNLIILLYHMFKQYSQKNEKNSAKD